MSVISPYLLAILAGMGGGGGALTIAAGSGVATPSSGKVSPLFLDSENANILSYKISTGAIIIADDLLTESNILKPHPTNAITGFSIPSPATIYKKEGDNVTGDAGTPGANVTHDGTNWANDLIASSTAFNVGNYNTDASSPYTINATSATAWRAFDGTPSDVFLGAVSNSTEIEIPGGIQFGGFKIHRTATSNESPKDFKVEGWNGSAYVEVYSTTGEAAGTGLSNLYSLTSKSNYTKYKFTVDATNGGASYIYQLLYYEDVIATSSNGVPYTTGATGSVEVPPSTLLTKKNDGTVLLDGEYNIKYKLDAAAYTSYMTPTVFKALANLTVVSSLILDIQVIGTAEFDSVQVTTESSDSLVVLNGIAYEVNAVVATALRATGVEFPDTKIQICSATEVDTTDMSNPPTDAELDAAFGIPSVVQAGFRRFIDDNNAGANFYEVISDGTNWWVTTFTKAV